MAIFCLANDIKDLEKRIGNITVAYTRNKKPIYAKDLNAHGPMTVLLKEAIRPNITQTLENNPAIIHGGPFANIAHGCNSVIATKAGLKLADYVVTEAGFGADLGAEKFLDIKCRKSGLKPDCVVIVATVRALKMHGGLNKDQLKNENVDALNKGLVNLERHINNMKKFGLPVTVAINKFIHDTKKEENAVIDFCKDLGVIKCQIMSKRLMLLWSMRKYVMKANSKNIWKLHPKLLMNLELNFFAEAIHLLSKKMPKESEL